MQGEEWESGQNQKGRNRLESKVNPPPSKKEKTPLLSASFAWSFAGSGPSFVRSLYHWVLSPVYAANLHSSRHHVCSRSGISLPLAFRLPSASPL